MSSSPSSPSSPNTNTLKVSAGPVSPVPYSIRLNRMDSSDDEVDPRDLESAPSSRPARDAAPAPVMTPSARNSGPGMQRKPILGRPSSNAFAPYSPLDVEPSSMTTSSTLTPTPTSSPSSPAPALPTGLRPPTPRRASVSTPSSPSSPSRRVSSSPPTHSPTRSPIDTTRCRAPSPMRPSSPLAPPTAPAPPPRTPAVIARRASYKTLPSPARTPLRPAHAHTADTTTDAALWRSRFIALAAYTCHLHHRIAHAHAPTLTPAPAPAEVNTDADPAEGEKKADADVPESVAFAGDKDKPVDGAGMLPLLSAPGAADAVSGVIAQVHRIAASALVLPSPATAHTAVTALPESLLVALADATAPLAPPLPAAHALAVPAASTTIAAAKTPDPRLPRRSVSSHREALAVRGLLMDHANAPATAAAGPTSASLDDHAAPPPHLLPLLDDSPVFRQAVQAQAASVVALGARLKNVCERMQGFSKGLQGLAAHAASVSQGLGEEWGEVDSLHAMLLQHVRAEEARAEGRRGALSRAASTVSLDMPMQSVAALFAAVNSLATQLACVVSATATQPLSAHRQEQAQVLRAALNDYHAKLEAHEVALERFLSHRAGTVFEDTPAGVLVPALVGPEEDIEAEEQVLAARAACQTPMRKPLAVDVASSAEAHPVASPLPTHASFFERGDGEDAPITRSGSNTHLVVPGRPRAASPSRGTASVSTTSTVSNTSDPASAGGLVASASSPTLPGSSGSTRARGSMDIIGFGSGGVVTMGKRTRSASTAALTALTTPVLDDQHLLAVARRDMELARAKVVLTLNQLRGTARVQLVSCAVESVAAFKAFFSEGVAAVDDQLACLREYVQALAATEREHTLHERRTRNVMLRAMHALSCTLPPRAVVDFPLASVYGSNLPQHRLLLPGLGGEAVLHSGYLRKQASNLSREWQRRSFVLTERALYYYREGKAVVPHHVLDTVLCGVKLPSGKSKTELDYTFEVVSPNKRYYVLQAQSEQDRQAWMAALQLGIARGLAGLQGHKKGDEAGAGDSVPPTGGTTLVPSASAAAGNDASATSTSARASSRATPQQMLLKLCRLNDTCADCDAPHPDWACINHGTLICIQCSGVHRSLGVQVSKVRSTTLDVWEPELCEFMLAVGNAAFNSIYEAAIPPFMRKPTPQSPHEERDEFIQLKYVKRAFLSKAILEKLVMPQPQLQQALLLATLYGDLKALLQLVTVGAQSSELAPCPVFVVANPAAQQSPKSNAAGSPASCARLLLRHERQPSDTVLIAKGTPVTALHVCALQGDLCCLEYLLQNNGNWSVLDGEGKTPAQRAAEVGNAAVVERLCKK